MSRRGLGKRYEGRLFVLDGCLHLVTEINPDANLARVCCRVEGQPSVIEMTVDEVGTHLAEGSDIHLDALSTKQTQNRIEERRDGWFFPTRDGLQGPFASNNAAAEALDEYLLVSQSRRKQGNVQGPAAH